MEVRPPKPATMFYGRRKLLAPIRLVREAEGVVQQAAREVIHAHSNKQPLDRPVLTLALALSVLDGMNGRE